MHNNHPSNNKQKPLINITPEDLAEYERMSKSNTESTINQLSNLNQQYNQIIDSIENITPHKSAKQLFEAPTALEDLKIHTNCIEDLLLKYLYSLGQSSGLELANKLRITHNTIINPILVNLADKEFIYTLRSIGMGGHNKVYSLTNKGRERAKECFQKDSYLGPCPVSLDDYLKAVNNYPKFKVPPFQQLKEFYNDLVVDEEFLKNMAIALSSGESLFLYGQPGMGKTTLIKKFIQCANDYINIPFAIYHEGMTISFYDQKIHKPINQEFNLNTPIKQYTKDERWLSIKRPCVLVATEFTAKTDINIQYNEDSTISSMPITTKANGGMFIIDDFGRQAESPEYILNLWITKLEGNYDILKLKTGQQFTVPYKSTTIFTTNLQPEKLLDDAFLRRLSYKLQIPNTNVKQYCQIFANEAIKQKVQWTDDLLEYLITEYYQKPGRVLAADHPHGIMERIATISQYNEQKAPYILTKAILDQAWSLHFLK